MKTFTYESGEDVKKGDQITYHGELGNVEFVVTEKVGDPARDWYIDRFPGGGFMIHTGSLGSVFVTESDTDEDLQLVSRG